jgi:hypothetical protein
MDAVGQYARAILMFFQVPELRPYENLAKVQQLVPKKIARNINCRIFVKPNLAIPELVHCHCDVFLKKKKFNKNNIFI